jgi:Rrf2 family protein
MAVHVLSVLAYQQGDRVTSTVLAESVNTNPVIIRRLLLSLQRAKLVDTCRGAGAGSRLNRSPRRINMAEIYRSVEETEPFATLTRKPDAHCPIGRSIIVVMDGIFASACSAMERDLAKTTLADVIERIRATRSRK